MKTKLLRKVRKRYEILWYPKGGQYSYYSVEHPFYVIKDKNYGGVRGFHYNTYDEAFENLVKLIKSDYLYTREDKKVWHKQEVLNSIGKK